jgi:hypothetical protein
MSGIFKQNIWNNNALLVFKIRRISISIYIHVHSIPIRLSLFPPLIFRMLLTQMSFFIPCARAAPNKGIFLQAEPIVKVLLAPEQSSPASAAKFQFGPGKSSGSDVSNSNAQHEIKDDLQNPYCS